MPAKDERKAWQPKFQKVQRQSSGQTGKANATPRIGQGTRTRSAYHKAFDGQTKGKYPGQTGGYNVGRTRRTA